MRSLLRIRGLAIVAAAIWIAVVVVAPSADWSLTCTVHGQSLGGVDCLQNDGAIPQTPSAPASWFGFILLAVAWCISSVTLAAFAFVALRRWRVASPSARAR
jgi:hypothetical protein